MRVDLSAVEDKIQDPYWSKDADTAHKQVKGVMDDILAGGKIKEPALRDLKKVVDGAVKQADDGKAKSDVFNRAFPR